MSHNLFLVLFGIIIIIIVKLRKTAFIHFLIKFLTSYTYRSTKTNIFWQPICYKLYIIIKKIISFIYYFINYNFNVMIIVKKKKRIFPDEYKSLINAIFLTKYNLRYKVYIRQKDVLYIYVCVCAYATIEFSIRNYIIKTNKINKQKKYIGKVIRRKKKQTF